MSQAWNEAIQEFTATTAAINAGALARAGLLSESERNNMLVLLAAAEKVARTPDQIAIAFSIRHILSTPVTSRERSPISWYGGAVLHRTASFASKYNDVYERSRYAATWATIALSLCYLSSLFQVRQR